MKTLLKVGLLILLPLLANSQTQRENLDSLHLALKGAANGHVKLVTLQSLYLYYIESNRDSALIYVEQALDISKKIKQPLWTASVLLNKAYVLQKKGNLPLVFKLINESMILSQEAKNEKNVYIEADSKDDPYTYRMGILASGFHQLGNVYKQAGNREKSISSYKKTIRIGEEIKREALLVNSNMNIGSIYLELNKLDSAELYSRQALQYSNKTGYKLYQGMMLHDIGAIFLKRNQVDSARYYYRQSLSVSREQHNFAIEIGTHISLAKLYQGLHQTDSMLYYANAAYAMSKNLKVGTQIATSAELISKAFKQRGNTDSALAYLSISKAMGDSLSKVRNEKLTEFQNMNFEEQMRLEKAAQENIADKNKIRTIGLFVGLALLAVLAFIFYRNNRQKQKANTVLETTLTNLKSTQSQLIQSEKMASLGELTAGIAHEIQNPLNFVNNFSEISSELANEMEEALAQDDKAEAIAISGDIKENLKKINHHGKRADAIVKGMLQHSRANTGKKESTDINALADEYLRLSYHGLRAKDKSFNSNFTTDFDENMGSREVVPQEIGRVLLNLYNNAFYSVNEKKRQLNGTFQPAVTVSTRKSENTFEILVKDNGNGIPQKILDKIYQPFYTTKPTGEGTGLGLSLSYDIIKAHGGTMKVETKEGEGAEFIITIPSIQTATA